MEPTNKGDVAKEVLKLSQVIPIAGYNATGDLKRCLASLRGSTVAPLGGALIFDLMRIVLVIPVFDD